MFEKVDLYFTVFKFFSLGFDWVCFSYLNGRTKITSAKFAKIKTEKVPPIFGEFLHRSVGRRS